MQFLNAFNHEIQAVTPVMLEPLNLNSAQTVREWESHSNYIDAKNLYRELLLQIGLAQNSPASRKDVAFTSASMNDSNDLIPAATSNDEERILSLYKTFSDSVSLIGHKKPNDIKIPELVECKELFDNMRNRTDHFLEKFKRKVSENMNVMLNPMSSLPGDVVEDWVDHSRYKQAVEIYRVLRLRVKSSLEKKSPDFAQSNFFFSRPLA